MPGTKRTANIDTAVSDTVNESNTNRRWSDEEIKVLPGTVGRLGMRRQSVHEMGTHLYSGGQQQHHQQQAPVLHPPHPPAAARHANHAEAMIHHSRRRNSSALIGLNFTDADKDNGASGPRDVRLGAMSRGRGPEDLSQPADTARPSSHRNRPKSAKYGYRKPNLSSTDLSDSACELEIETLNLDDSDKDSGTSYDSGKPPGDAACAAWDDRVMTGRQGDRLNNARNTMRYQGNATNKRNSLSGEWDAEYSDIESDDSDDNLFDDESGESGGDLSSPNHHQGTLRIKRKHLRRRYLSAPDSEDPPANGKHVSVPDQDNKRRNSLLNGEIDSVVIAEKVAAKYRRRAVSDVSQMAHSRTMRRLDEIAGSQSLNNSQTNKRALPPMPRKLRPIFKRAQDTLCSGDLKHQDTDLSKPEVGDMNVDMSTGHAPIVTVLPPSFRNKTTDSPEKVIPTSPQNVEKNKSRQRLKPLKPLTIEAGDENSGYSSGELNFSTESSPDSACVPDRVVTFNLPHRRLSDTRLAKSPGPLTLSRENSFILPEDSPQKTPRKTLEPILQSQPLANPGGYLPERKQGEKIPAFRTRSLPLEPVRITRDKSLREMVQELKSTRQSMDTSSVIG